MFEDKREVHGFTHDGERIFLGRCTMTDKQVTAFLSGVADAFSGDGLTVFTVRSAVFDSKSFSGVQVTPPIKE